MNGNPKKQKNTPTSAAPNGTVQAGWGVKGIYAAFLALACFALYKSPWTYIPIKLDLIKSYFLGFDVVKYNLKMAVHFQGLYFQFLWGWLVFIAMSTWFYVSGKFLFQYILNFRSSQQPPPPDEFALGEKASVCWFLGAWAWAMVWFILGTAGLFKSQIGFILIAAGLLIFIWKFSKTIKTLDIKNQFKEFTQFSWIKLFSSILFLWVLLWSTLVVIPQSYWDTLMINMALPGYYVAEGKFLPNIFHTYTYFAQNNELLLTWTLLVKSKEAAFFLNWAFLAVFFVFLYGWLSRITSKTVALCSIAVFIATPLAEFFVKNIKNDFQVGLFLVLQWWALLSALKKITAQEPDAGKWIFLSGLFSGISYGFKFTAVPSITVTFVCLSAFLSYISGGSIKNRLLFTLRYLSVFLLGFFISAGPWLIRALILTGNPLYPFLGKLFNSQLLYSWHAHPETVYRLITTGPSGVARYFQELWEGQQAICWGPSAVLGITGLLTLIFPCSAEKRWVTAAVMTSWSLSLFFAMKPQYHIGPLMFILCVCFGFLLHAVLQSEKNAMIRRITISFIILAFARNFAYSTTKQYIAFSSAALVSGSRYYHWMAKVNTDTRSLASIDEIDFVNHLINQHTGKNEKVLFMGTVRPAGIERRHYSSFSTCKQPILFFAEQSKDDDDLKDRLVAIGVRHIVIDPALWSDWIRNVTMDEPHNIPINNADLEKINRFLSKYAALRFMVPSGKLLWYSIADKPNEPLPPVMFDSIDTYQFPIHCLEFANITKQKDIAIQILEQLKPHVLSPDITANTNVLLGSYYFELKDYDKAILYLSETLRFQDSVNYRFALTKRAFSYQAMGKYDLALKDWERAVELEPGNPDLINQRNYLLSQAHRKHPQ